MDDEKFTIAVLLLIVLASFCSVFLLIIQIN